MRDEPWIPANPAPLGLAGFGLTTLVLSLVNSNLINAGDAPVVLGMAFAYGGLAQFMAGMWEFRTGNTFGAVAFTSYGAFWLSAWWLLTRDAKLIPPTAAASALGAYFWAWGILTALLLLCAFRQPIGVILVFLGLTVTFVLLGIGHAGGSTNTIHAGGWAGIITAALALYCMVGMVMRHQYGRALLPFTGT
jgi:hypothetical protein